MVWLGERKGFTDFFEKAKETHYDDEIRDEPWRTTRTAKRQEERRSQSKPIRLKEPKHWFISGLCAVHEYSVLLFFPWPYSSVTGRPGLERNVLLPN